MRWPASAVDLVLLLAVKVEAMGGCQDRRDGGGSSVAEPMESNLRKNSYSSIAMVIQLASDCQRSLPVVTPKICQLS